MRLVPAALVVASALTLASCSGGTPTTAPTASGQPVAVATTTQLGSVLGEITACVGTTSTTLMGPGDDPHTFAVSSAQVAQMVRAKLVVVNGLGLEEGMTRALDNVRADGGRVLEVAPTVDPLAYADLGTDASTHAGETDAEHAAHGTQDPHFWMDARRMGTAAKTIGAELAQATGDAAYASCGDKVAADLGQVDADVRQALAVVPEERRVLVTDHESFNYFADAYGFRVAGVVIPGGSTDAEPSSADLAALVTTIRNEKVSAIFSNNTVDPRLVEAVAREVGGDLRVIRLYEGSVGEPGSDASTYAGMMRADARLIADALA